MRREGFLGCLERRSGFVQFKIKKKESKRACIANACESYRQTIDHIILPLPFGKQQTRN